MGPDSPRATRSPESLAFSRYLVAANVVGLTALALVASWLDDRIRKSLLGEVVKSSVWFVERHISPLVQELDTRDVLSDRAKNRLSALAAMPMLNRKIVDIKIWNTDKSILFSANEAEVGTSPPSTSELDRAIAGKISSQLDDRHDLESAPQRSDGSRIFEVYYPVKALASDRTIAVAELYLDGAELVEDLWKARWQNGLIMGLLSLQFFSMIFGLAWHSRNVSNLQNREIEQNTKIKTILEAQSNQLAQRVVEAQQRNVELTDQVLMQVGSDLHDGPAQLLGVALLRLGEIPAPDTSQSRLGKRDHERIEAARVMTQDALSELRHMAKGLVLPQIEGLHTTDVVKMAIENHKRTTLTEVKLELMINAPDLPSSIKRCLFRCIQEGLNNAFRHAGGQEQLVRVLAEQKRVVLSIMDAGPGLNRLHNCPPDALGLAGLRNRIEVLGGYLDIKSSVGGGTELSVELPLVDRHGQSGTHRSDRRPSLNARGSRFRPKV
jgi:signal transduction histidine kinase